jgi:hypothetical protein
VKLEFLRREQDSWERQSEETWRITAVEAWLVEAQKRTATLHNELADFHIRYDEAVTITKESGEKLVALIERAHRDQEEAQKVKSERDELS